MGVAGRRRDRQGVATPRMSGGRVRLMPSLRFSDAHGHYVRPLREPCAEKLLRILDPASAGIRKMRVVTPFFFTPQGRFLPQLLFDLIPKWVVKKVNFLKMIWFKVVDTGALCMAILEITRKALDWRGDKIRHGIR